MQFVDRAYLAHESMASLEAVLPATMLSWIFLGFFQSVVAYAGVFVAQYHGAGDERGCVASYRAGVWISVASGLLLLLLVPVGGWIFSLTTPSADVLSRQKDYYGIITAGGFFVCGQMAASAYYTGRGRTRLVFWVNLVGNLVNVALDPILIFGWCGVPKLGISGAAFATVGAMALQWLVLTLAVRRETRKLDLRSPSAAARLVRPQTSRLVWNILRYGTPSGGYSILNALSFTIFVFVTGRVGDVAFAASNACFTVNYLLFAPMEGFALGVQTLVGQARGRGDDAGAGIALRRTLVLALGFVAAACIVVLAAHRPILALFTPDDLAASGEFISLGRRLLVLMAAWLLFDAADVIGSGALKGAGDTRFVFVWMLVCAFVLWMPLVGVVLACGGGMVPLWSTMIVYVVLLCIGTLLRWMRGSWRRHKLV